MKSYFTIEELCKSTTATQLHIDNTPSQQVKENLSKLIEFSEICIFIIAHPLKQTINKNVPGSSYATLTNSFV